jgi:inosose dehydratase
LFDTGHLTFAGEDPVAVAPPVASAGYEGWPIVEAEQDPAKAHPLTHAKKGYANLRRFAEQAGFRIAAS